MDISFQEEMVSQVESYVAELDASYCMHVIASELYMPLVSVRMRDIRKRMCGILSDRQVLLKVNVSKRHRSCEDPRESASSVIYLPPLSLLHGHRLDTCGMGAYLLSGMITPRSYTLFTPKSRQLLTDMKYDSPLSVTITTSDVADSSPVSHRLPVSGYGIEHDVVQVGQLPPLPIRSYGRFNVVQGYQIDGIVLDTPRICSSDHSPWAPSEPSTEMYPICDSQPGLEALPQESGTVVEYYSVDEYDDVLSQSDELVGNRGSDYLPTDRNEALDANTDNPTHLPVNHMDCTIINEFRIIPSVSDCVRDQQQLRDDDTPRYLDEYIRPQADVGSIEKRKDELPTLEERTGDTTLLHMAAVKTDECSNHTPQNKTSLFKRIMSRMFVCGRRTLPKETLN